MNKKEILMICLIICFIFSLQTAVAADVDGNATDDTILTVQIDDTVSISNDLSSYSLPENDSIVRGENDGAGSFSDLQKLIDDDDTGTISLDKNYTFNSNNDSNLVQGIVISKDIVINGNDFTIDALSSARIFNIASGSTVTLNGIKFVNGGSASVTNGGSIYSDAQGLIIDKCTFDGSYAAKDGGAIYVNGDSCTVANSTFTDNIAGDDGGAIYWNGAGGTIYNITCENNKGISSGTSTSKGGTICFTGSNSVIDKSTFKDSSATFNGGALFITGENVNITNCDFSNCTSDITATPNADDLPYGGAMYILGNNALVDACTFDECSAIYGGAIYVLGNSATINDSTFTDNDATKDGGAIYIDGIDCTVSNSTFTDNTVGDDGGAIYWNGAHGSIYNITCTNNKGISSGTSTSKGGSISIIGDDITVDKSTFTDSSATFNGGALFVTGNDVNITNCDFSSCTSDDSAYTGSSSYADDLPYGGAMYIIGNNTLVDTCTFDDCTAWYGGAIYVSGDSAIINNSVFTNGESIEDAGAIYINGNDCKVYDSTFTDNTAGDDGGAIYWNGNNGIIDRCNFEDNIGTSTGDPADPSTSKGGTLSVTGDNVDISNSNFTGGITKNRGNANTGGAIFITGDDVDIDSCNFNDCSAEGADGGTIYIIGSRTTISNSNISDSTARAGGAIYIDGINASVIGSSFTNTFAKTGSTYDATNLGGAIYIKGNYAKISGSEFDESAAYSGGIIYLQGNYCNVSDSSFNGGSASNDGGAMYSTGSYSTVTNSNFTYNGAQGNGGAMYWYGGTNSKYNDIIGCLFEENVAYARSSSNTKGGGAIYWSEGGSHDSIIDSKFIRNSVQSDNKADGGAILWDRSNYVIIDNCIFDGDYITTSATGNVWVQGGALYLRVDSKAIINNSVFVNCSSDKEAGAIYVQSKSNLDANNPILIENTKFISNVAKAIAPNIYGGGAVQVKECNHIFFTNDSFINNTANNGGALSVYNAAEPVKLIGCVFTGNNATQNGGSIWFNKRIYLYNITVSDSHAENFGGGMYNENAELIHNNLTFINNTALNGGGVYWNRNSYTIHDMVFLNNTALEYGGAIYISKGGNTLLDVNMTGNKAFSGSAIYSTAAFTLTNAYLIENQANSSSLTFDSYDESTGKIVLLFKGKDKYLNAIYVTGSNRPTCTNVTYWNESGVANTGSSAVTLPNAADPTPEAGQNITVGVYDDSGNLVNLDNQYFITDKNGKIYLDLHDVVPSVPDDKYGEIYVEAILTNDDYYTIIKLTSRAPSSINASATNTTYHSNSTLSVNVTHGATGNVSVYLNDTFIGNITLDNSMGSKEISTLIEDKYLPAGNHTLTFVYNGNAKYDKSNTTAILEISKITPTLLVNVTGIEYNLVVNVTVMDGEYNISDATGNVTIEVADRTATIYLANGQGMTVIYGLPIGNYTVNATYNGDNNYYNTTNSTYGNVTEKIHTVIVLDVDNDKTYFINETVPIKVTVLPNAEGNITLYINGEPHVLPLQNVDNTTFVEFNATELKDGINYVFATYDGTDIYGPSWAEDTFNVTKYNATVIIKTDNITRGDTEVINITVPEDATGILNVTVNGTQYYIEIINGNATLPISGLEVGVYNVTVTFMGDKKYYNATNSTLFNVSKATPSIVVSVENITYGENATVIVTVPEDAKGNVTIKLNETVVFTQEPIDGQATFTLKNLKASNYTIEATFNGNENYTNASNSTNFTVFKATPELNVTVEDIYYGDAEHIIIKVNADGNVTVKVNGNETVLNITSAGNETYVYDLAVGNYPVEVTFNGNENYTEVTVTKDFNVYQVNTTLDVDVHDIVVWDKESINVTLAKNATGNVIININGENHTVPIVNGTAQLNLTNLTVGHKVVWVFYDGDRNYTANRTMAEFDVGQRSPAVNVTALNITVGQEGKITINIPANATGFVILSGNFTKRPIYVDEFTDGVAEITVDDLAVGNYSVHIKYYGDALDNYTVAENDTTFKVDNINTTISIEVESIDYGNSANITVTVNDDATGYITIKINETRNITLPIADGKVNWIVEGLAADNYTVYANYSGDDKYNGNKTNKTFEVRQISPDIVIVSVDSVAGKNATVVVKVDSRVTENVTITVNNKTYTKAVGEDGVVVFTTDVLDYGDYTITANYSGDKNFTADSDVLEFTTDQTDDYLINITAEDIYVGNNTNITVNVPKDATGKVIIELNGTNYTVDIVEGVAVLNNVSTLKAGVYDVTAYFGNDKYVNKTVSTRFVVSKVDSPVKVNVTNLYVDDTAYINVTVPDDADGTVTIEINGVSYGPESVVDGVARFVVPNVTYGNKTVAVTYSGTDKYVSNFTTANFTVSKRTPVVNVTNITVIDGKDAVINISGPGDRNASLVVTVDGVDYAVNMTGGNATLTVKGLSVDNYTVSVTYIENDKYVEGTASGWVNVIAKGTSAIIIGVEDVYRVGQEIVITLTPVNSTGAISVTINGKEYNITEDKITFENGLPNGTYEIVAVLDEDENYYGSSANATFIVVKNNITITVNDTTVPATIYVDSPVTFTANLNETVTGDVIFTINGANYTVHVSDSNVATYEYTPINNDTITVVATFMGNDKYNANASAPKQFNVNKVPTDINVTVKTPVTYGEDAVITVELNETINTTAKLLVDGKEYDVALINGKCVFNASGLNSGNHDVNVNYVGDYKYAGSKDSTSFTVDNATLDADVTALNVTVEENTTFVINVTDDFNGNVSIKVGDKVLYNGSVKTLISADKLPAGDKTATVVFYGDSNYDELTLDNVKFTVSRVTPDITVEIDDVTYPNKAIAVINVGNNANGTVNVTVDGKVFNGTVSNGVANVDLTNLSAGNKVVAVEFFATDDYNGNATAGTKFIIYPNNSLINVKDNAGIYKVGEEINIVFETINSTGDLKIYLNGKQYGDALDGNPKSHVVCFDDLGEGNYTITAVLEGSENYTGYTTTTSFEVVKNNITITVNDTTVPATIYVDSPVTFTANLNETVTGDVIFTINGANYTVHVSDSNVATYEYTPVNNDTITVVATFMGNDKYNGNVSAQKEFNVNKVSTDINVTVKTPITYGESANITVTVNDDATGYITIRINGTDKNITLPVADGKVNWIVDGLAADNYTVIANYSGDGKYNVNSTEKGFEVEQISPDIVIVSVDSVAGKNATVIVKVDPRVTENVTITVNNKTYSKAADGGIVVFTTDVLDYGTYIVTANYTGDKNFTADSDVLEFTTDQTDDYLINITAEDIYVGNNTNITVNVPKDATGKVIIELNGTNYTADIAEGVAVLNNVSTLKAGVYNVTAYFGNDKYVNKTVSTRFVVSKVDAPIKVDVEGLYVGDTAYINVTVPDDADGNVTIEINGKVYGPESVVDGVARFAVPGVTYGNKTVAVTYSGSDKYVSNFTTANFTVSKRESQVNVTADGGIVGGEAVINVTIPANATGYVIVNVDGTNYTVNTTNGIGSITIKGLGNATHTVNVTYIGDDQYLPSTNGTTFGIAKDNTTIEIDVDSITYGENANITVTVEDDATGYITIKINGTDKNITLPVVNGKVNWIVDGLAVGNYTVIANYSGDGKYSANETSKNFTVKKLDTIPIVIETQNITYGQVENITVYINATGNVTIKLNGEIEEEELVINDGKVVLPVSDLPVDNYTVEVIFNGNANYTNVSSKANFTVSKADPRITIETQNITYGEIEHIIVHVNASGKVNITVNGNTTTLDLSNGEETWKLRAAQRDAIVEYDGKATLHIYNLPVGEYPVEATYLGNDNYNEATARATFTVSQINTTLDVDVENIYVWDKEVINITLHKNATGELLVYVDSNKTPVHAPIVNGTAQVNLTGLTEGTHTVWVFYDGDRNFTANRTMETFEVSLRTPTINVTAQNITVGQVEEINITIPANATGYVVVTGNCSDNPIYVDTFVNGNATIKIKDLPEGNYTVHVKYYGDGNYTIAENDTTFTVSKVNTTIDIAVESIEYGEAANITVTVEDDATGYITIRINGTDKNVTLPVADGKVNWIVEGLAADNYTVIANYSGDGKYNVNSTEKGFEVEQISPDIVIVSVDSVAGKNATVIVKVDPRVTENVTITVNNKTYTKAVGDGIIVFTTDVLDYGTYIVTANYTGDKNFTDDYDDWEFTTNQTDDYLINITAEDIYVGNNTNITVNVPEDATGKVIIELNGTNYTCDINEDGVAVLNNVSTLKAGVYDVTAYFGNDKYVNKTVSTRFVVSKVDAPIKVDVENLYVGDTAYINVTVPDDADGNVTIEINGKVYGPESVVDGVARFVVPGVTYGNKTVAVSYSGTGKYVSNFTTANFTVSKRESQVNVTVDNGVVGEDTIINVTIPANATGYVIVNVDGTNYTVNTTNGEGSVTIKGLGNATHTVNVTYIGDDQYLPSTNGTTFGIAKDNTTIVIDVESIKYGEAANITVTVKDDATGYITIKINGTDNEITLPVADGKVNWIVEGLAADNYTVIANYSGDGKYNMNSTEEGFEVEQISPEIEIILVDSVADKNATVVVKVDPRVTENVTITVNNKTYTKAVDESGIVVFTTDVLDYGTYNVTANYAGDKNFTADYDVVEFTTNSTDDYVINITASDIEVGDNTNITVKLSIDDATSVIIELNGTNYTCVVNDGVAVLNNISTLKEGIYNVTAYFGNDKYVNKTASTRFAVSKVDTPISMVVINDTNIYVGDTVKVVVSVPDDVPENVTIEINGMTFTNATVDGNATFYVPNITYGNKTVVATYAGDDKFRFNSTTVNFTVHKRESFVEVNVSDINVGDVAVINVTVPANATGYVIVNVDGQDYAVNLTDGVGSVEIKGLANGTYPVKATYIGDDQYLSSINNNHEIKVNKVNPSVNITVSEDGIIANGSDVDITVKVPIDATGKVNITLSNGTSYIVPVVDGEAKLHLETPAVGDYGVTARYLGDDKYTENGNETSFEVYDNSKEVIVISPDTFVNVNNTVSVVLTGAHQGEVTIIISNESGVVVKENATLTVQSANGIDLSTASLTLDLLDAGKYNVSVIYIEHDGVKVIVHEGESDFDVYKLSSEIKIKEIKNITVGENATIELEIILDARANDGNISVWVDGKEYVTNTSTLKVTVPDLVSGKYDVEAFYHGNRWYNESNATSSFEVTKNIAPISINVTNSYVDEVEQINVTLPENAIGYVIINVDGQDYHANVTDGLAQVNITGLKAGVHNVTAVYVENYKFYGNATNTTLTVSKLNSTVTVKADDIIVGDVAAVNITVITGASGNVTIVIGDEWNETVGITDGVFSVIVPGLTVGNKTVNVTYNGNDKYLPSSNSTNFTVTRTSAGINLVVENITYGEIETITAFVNATGNVTIKLNGTPIGTATIEDGKATFDIERLDAGNYTVEVVYNGDTNTNSTSVKANFTVEKADPEITVEVKDIIYGDVEHIIIHVNAEGNVTIKVNGEVVEELTLENGNAILKVSRWDVPEYEGNATVDVYNLPVGNYPVEVTFNGNENYNKATATTDFDVLKDNTTVSVDVQQTMKVDQSQVINITINNTNATGNVTVIVDGKNYTVALTNGTANYTIENLSAGNHTVVVIYEGDKNLNGNWTYANIEVTKLDSFANISISNSTVGDKQIITVEVPENATGQVLIDIDGQHYYANISDGKATLELDTLPEGEHDVVATYLGDDRYLRSSSSDKFNVSKNNSTLDIAPQDITYGDSETITFTVPEDATGNITVVVNNETYTVPVSSGTGTLTIPKLPAGNYTINATYNGDDKYKPVTSSAEFEVSKANVTDIKVIDQGNSTVVVVVGDNATGNITIKVGDNNYTAEIINGTAVIDLVNETPGEHDLEVIYSGDDNHEPATTNATATIPKLVTPISVEVDDIEVDENAKVVVNVPGDAKGNVTIEIDGVKYTAPIEDGKATFDIENLTAGVKTIAVDYAGDNNYTGNHTTANFTVNKVTPEITVSATNITVGDKTLIEVTAPSDVTRPVLVDVDGIGYYVNLTDGKGSIEVPISKEGTYDVSATYLGDDKYTNASANTTFKASKVSDSSINVTVENITVGDKAVIEVSVPSDATGNVTITVDGKDYVVPVANGTATLVVPGLEAGNYTVDAVYNGDDKYESTSNSTKLEVSKVKVDDIKVIDQNNGTLIVVVGDNATGNVTVKVGNETYTAEVVNGTAVITLENNTPGTYDVEVEYSGDDTHTAGNATSKATIPKLDTPISINVSGIKVGDNAQVVVNVPDDAKGDVTIEIDGVEYTAPIKDGKATFDVENLTAGTKTVYVNYIGDNNYTGNHTSANFTVDKRTSTVDAETSPINVGETAVINITVPNNATGHVIVEIANQTYAVEVENGTGTLEVKGLASGTHDINVKYLGDDQYLPSNATSSIEVSKVPSTISVTADNITVGDKAVINVEVPEDLCGNVTVSVDGKNYTVFVSGGKGTLVIPDLAAGEYTVDAIFDGCKKYEPSNATTKFTVSKKESNDIKVIDQNNGTLIVVVGDNATGNVTVKVGNETYTAEVVNGTAVITLENNTPGTYDVEVEYSGDDTHAAGNATSKATIPKLDTPISVEVDDIKVGDTAQIVVNVPDDAKGDVTIEIDGVKYTAPIKDGKATFNVENLTAGNKTIAVDYVGDNNYTGNHTTAKITVSKCESEVSATIDDSNVGDNVTVTVKVPKDATGQVLVDIDGVGYYVNVTDGTGTVEIPRIPSGVYNVTVTYPGDDKYLPSSNSTTFKVNKVESFVIPKAQDIYVGDNEEITISVPSDATGTVTLVIDGKEYDFSLDDGTLSAPDSDGKVYDVAVSYGNGKLTVSGLPKGEYTVSARYNGDDKYLPSTNTTTFKVLKKSSTMDVTDLGNGTVVVDLPDDATGNVTIKVGNNTYTAPVVDGKAIVDLTNETPGTHDIEVTYSGDDKHNKETEDSKVTIPKYDTPISVDVDDCKVGDTAVVTVNLPDGATGNVTIEINGKSYTAEVKDGKAVFNVTGLEAGNKTVAVKYDGDDNYVGNSTTGQFTVSKRESTVKASSKNITVGKDEVITVTVPKDATGRVLVDIDGVGYYGTIVNGKAKVVIPELPSGKYTAKVTYEGDDKYLPSTTTTKFTVTKVKTPISATGDEIEQGQDATVVVKLPSDATGTVTITVDGKKYTTEVVNGKAVFTVPGLSSGDHDVTASYSGDKKYEANDTITDIDVIPGHDDNGGENAKHVGAALTKHATGNPILVLLLIILVLGSTQIRRLKK